MIKSNNNLTNHERYQHLLKVFDQLPIYFTYSLVLPALVFELCGLSVLFLRRRSNFDNSIMIYLLKWQYSIGVFHILNMAFADPLFTVSLFKYVVFENVSDSMCKFENYTEKLIYCLAPWIQVVKQLDIKEGQRIYNQKRPNSNFFLKKLLMLFTF